MKVYKTPCKNCLLSPDPIVSPKRRKEILQKVVQEQSYFICHKATQESKEICCRTFYDRLGHHSQLIRIMERLNGIEFIEQPEAEKLPTHKEMNSK